MRIARRSSFRLDFVLGGLLMGFGVCLLGRSHPLAPGSDAPVFVFVVFVIALRHVRAREG